MTDKELRVLPRIPIKIVVEINDGKIKTMTFCDNLGTGGIFLESVNPPSMGSKLELTFTLPNNKKKLKLKGVVTWIQRESKAGSPAGYGIKFQDATESDAKELEKTLKYLTKLTEGA
ncbi:MAG: PilZ domain-containing protein [Bdellovibrionia bacterium]